MSKKGQRLLEDEQKFCERMQEKHSEEYKRMTEEVLEATRPFGSVR